MTGHPSKLRSLGANLLLLASSLVVTFAVLEVGVRLFVDLRANKPIRIGDVDLETKLAFLPNRERSYETGEFRMTVATNAHGRRDVEWSEATFADPDNILFIGDSFVFGNGVEQEQTIPSVIEALAAESGRPVEVYNFGMPAAAIAQYALNLEDALRLGIQARRIVIGVFVGNDFDPDFLPSHQAAAAAAAAAQPPEPSRPSLLQRSKLIQLLKWRIAHSPRLVGLTLAAGRLTGLRLYTTPAAYIFFRKQTPEEQEAFQSMLGFLGKMKRLASENRRELYVVVFPNKIQVENREDLESDSYEAEKPNRLILEYCEEHDIACLDLLPVLSEAYARSGEPLYYPVDRHLNALGCRLSAEAIHAFLAGRRAS